ncbi:hypothetical protein GCM10010372_44010 [Streptomyces tauricus]|nr:hypothetical protein GCM10010372_44010 [Streptomyces tauricus]
MGALDDELADELGEAGKDVEDESAAGGGGVEVLVERSEANAAVAEFGNHVDEILQAAAVSVERGDGKCVAGFE